MYKTNFLSGALTIFGVILITVTSYSNSSAQYLETFSTPGRGYLINCVNNRVGLNWFLSSWDTAGTCQVADLRDPTDYFNTTAAGVLESIDLDQEVCWFSPLLNISTAGTVTASVDLSWAGYDTDIAANNCSGDYIRVNYSVNGGAYTMIPNQVGGDPCATVAYPFGAVGAPFTSNTIVTQGGITGNTLRTSVCVFTNANAEMVTIDNVRVPQAGVALVPTAAPASISGRVTTADGRGIGGAVVSISGGGLGQPRIARTASFGYFTIDGLDTGETYIVSVGSKRFTFPEESRVVSLTDSIADLDFVADPMR